MLEICLLDGYNKFVVTLTINQRAYHIVNTSCKCLFPQHSKSVQIMEERCLERKCSIFWPSLIPRPYLSPISLQV